MKIPDTEWRECDVLVIGAGLAGCWAALAAKEQGAREVVLVDKGRLARSGTTLYCHDMLAPVPEGQQQVWLQEAAEHAEYLNDEELLEILLAEEGDRINDLQSWGVSFEKDAKGELALVKGRGHCKSRNVLFDGRDLMQVMKTRLVSQEVSLVQRVMILDLLTSDGSQPTQARVNGALGIDISTGTFKVFSAKAIVVATGVVGAKLHLAYSDNLTGDGQAMALRAGAELGSLELNFCPVFVSPVKPGLAISAGLLAFQTLGARFVNSRGERFLKNYFPDAQEQSLQLGPLGQASAKEILEGRGPLYFDLRHFDDAKVDQIRRILAVKISAFKSSGVDVFRQPVPYVPLLGYFGGGPSGGICVNQWGESTCSGLLAAGICAEFFGCAEFLSGGTLAFCNVFGYRAGRRAAEIAVEPGRAEEINRGQLEKLKHAVYAPMHRLNGVTPRVLYQRLARWFTRPEYGLVKSEETIKAMLAEIRRVRQEDLTRASSCDLHTLVMANELRNFLTLLESIYLSALERKESRLTHYRLDFPFRDDLNWLKWIIVRQEEDGLTLRHQPVPIGRNRIVPSQREKIPAPIQFSRPS